MIEPADITSSTVSNGYKVEYYYLTYTFPNYYFISMPPKHGRTHFHNTPYGWTFSSSDGPLFFSWEPLSPCGFFFF